MKTASPSITEHVLAMHDTLIGLMLNHTETVCYPQMLPLIKWYSLYPEVVRARSLDTKYEKLELSIPIWCLNCRRPLGSMLVPRGNIVEACHKCQPGDNHRHTCSIYHIQQYGSIFKVPYWFVRQQLCLAMERRLLWDYGNAHQ